MGHPVKMNDSIWAILLENESSGNGDNLLDIPIQRLLKHSRQDIVPVLIREITLGVESKECYSRYKTN